MNKKVIIITGYLAAGKTTFAQALSKELGIPYFSKDLIKVALSRDIIIDNRDDSKRLSAATFDAIEHITERFMETANPLIIEANFVMNENHGGRREGDALKSLIDRYGYKALTYVFTGDFCILCDRFNERDRAPERGDANRLPEPFTYEAFKEHVSPLGEFNIGGDIVRIDATDYNAVDFTSHIEAARLFISG